MIVAGQKALATDVKQIANLSYTAKEAITAGTPVGVSDETDGYVAKAKKIYQELGYNLIKIAKVDTNKVVGVYADGQNMYAVAISFSELTATVGTPVLVDTLHSSTSYRAYAIAQLTTDKFIIFYIKSGTSQSVVTGAVCSVSTLTITVDGINTAKDMNWGGGLGVTGLSALQIDTNSAIFFADCSSATQTGRAVAVSVSGTAITAGAVTSIFSGSHNSIRLQYISTNKVIAGNGLNGAVQVYTISSLAITAGTVYSSPSTHSIDGALDLLYIGSNTILILGAVSSTERFLCAGTISGTVVSYGTPVTAGSFDDSYNSYYAGFYGGLGYSSTSFYVFTGGTFSASPLNNITLEYLLKYSVSGTTITLEYTTAFENRIATQVSSYFNSIQSLGVGFVYFSNTGKVTIQGMSSNYIGFAKETKNAGETIQVTITGKDDNQTGLLTGVKYAVSNGSLSVYNESLTTIVGKYRTREVVNIVVALSPTSVRI